jgi:hypothetical protein
VRAKEGGGVKNEETDTDLSAMSYSSIAPVQKTLTATIHGFA